MTRIRELLDSVAADIEAEIEHGAHSSRITVKRGERSQTVHIRIVSDECELRSVVLPASDVTATDTGWRNLTRLAWRRNADANLVTFTFDNQDRMLGQIRLPAATLRKEELSLSIQSLVRECDRLEYLLSGADRN